MVSRHQAMSAGLAAVALFARQCERGTPFNPDCPFNQQRKSLESAIGEDPVVWDWYMKSLILCKASLNLGIGSISLYYPPETY